MDTRERDDEFGAIDLRPYMIALWRWKWAIAAVTIACAVVAFALSRRTPPVYEARVQVCLLPRAQVIPQPSAVIDRTDLSQSATMAAFRALPANQGLAAQVVRDLRLDAPPFNLSAAAFSSACVSMLQVGLSNVTTVAVRLPDPAMAARAANQYAARAIELSAKLDQDELRVVGRQMEHMKGRFAEVAARVDAAERERGGAVAAASTASEGSHVGPYRAVDPGLGELYFDYNVVQAMYADTVMRYERMRLQAATRSSQLQILDPAVPPVVPVAPRPRHDAAVGALAGFAVSVAVVLLVQLVALAMRPALARR